MKHLYFLRHGETEDNVNNIFSGPQTLLNDNGRKEAHQAGQAAAMEHLHFDIIISSTYPRALETAQIFASEIGFPIGNIEMSDHIVERSVGIITNTTYDSFFNAGHSYKDIDAVEGVETIAALQDRAADALRTIIVRPEDSILVVSHGAFGRAFRRALLGIPYTDEYRDARPHDPIPNATLLKLV